MQGTPFWFLVLQAIANFAIVCTFIVYWRQLAAMRGQLVAAREASHAQSVLTLIEFLQTPNHREDRRVLISLAGKPVASWKTQERDSAERVCATYNIAGLLIREGIVPEHIIVPSWSNSISTCYNAASEILEEVRKSRGENHWSDFDWLASRAAEGSTKIERRK